MKSLSLILFILVIVLLLIKNVSIRIIYRNKIRIELEYFPIFLVFDDFKKNRKKKARIKYRLLFKRARRLINQSTVRVISLPPRNNEGTSALASGVIYSLIYPAIAYLSSEARQLRFEEIEAPDTLDLCVNIRLYFIIKELILFLFDIIKENIVGKHA